MTDTPDPKAAPGQASGGPSGAPSGRAAKRDIPVADADYLRLLGQRVRKARGQRGMSRKILARDSGVSERYLAQLEGGNGNASVLLLRQIARAMDMQLADLVSDAPERPVDTTLILQFLGRLSADELSEARHLLAQSFEAAEGTRAPGRIALIGLRGGGKSTLGKKLAQHLRVPFVELNKMIEEEYGASVAEIFNLYGQPAFRRYERRCLESIIERYDRVVIATGGGIVAEPGTFDLLLSACRAVWVQASPEEHMQRVLDQGDLRPMANNAEAMEDLKNILAAREPYYAKAEIHLDTSGRAAEVSFADLCAALAL